MKLKELTQIWNRWTRRDINDNFKKIEKNFSGVVDIVSNKAYNEVVDAARLIWQEPVDTFADLATTYPNAQEGWASMARDTGVVYRYNSHGEWKPAQEISAGPFNEMDHRLTTQLAQIEEIVVNANNYDTIQGAIDAAPPYATVTIPGHVAPIITDTLSIIKPVHLVIKSRLKSLLNKDIIQITGTKSANDYVLVSAVNRGANSITLTTSSHDISAGDVIVIRDDATRITDGATNVNMETHEVESINGATIRLKGRVGYRKEIATANVYKISCVNDVIIEGAHFIIADGSESGCGINADMVKNLTVNNLMAENGVGAALRTKRTLTVKVNSFDVKNPQARGSGEGYGLHFYSGTNEVFVQNGKGNKMRHTVDCSSAYNVLLDNITASNDSSASFGLIHNGWGGDITCRDCHVVNGAQYGFWISGQGFVTTEWMDKLVGGITLINCTAHLINDDLNQAGFKSDLPIADLHIKNFKTIFKDGTVVSNSNSAGIATQPINNTGIIEDIHSKGFYYGINQQATVNTQQINKTDVLKMSNIFVEKAGIAVRSFRGAKRNFSLKNLITKDLSIAALSLDGGNVDMLTIEDVTLSNVGALFDTIATTSISQGYLNSLKSLDIESYLVNVSEGYKLTQANIYLMSRANVINLAATSAVTLSAYPLLDGIVLGQKITLLNTSDFAVTVPISAKLYTRDSANKVLSKNQSLSLIWINNAWREI